MYPAALVDGGQSSPAGPTVHVPIVERVVELSELASELFSSPTWQSGDASRDSIHGNEALRPNSGCRVMRQ